MSPHYKRTAPAVKTFFTELGFAIAQAGYSYDEVSLRIGRARTWLRARFTYGRPLAAYHIDSVCRGAGIPDEKRLYLHKLAALALGYEV